MDNLPPDGALTSVDNTFGNLGEDSKKVSKWPAPFQWLFFVSTLVGMAVTFSISIPFVLIFAVVVAFGRHVWLGYDVATRVRSKAAVVYLAETELQLSDDFLDAKDRVLNGDTPLEVFKEKHFWIALAGLHNYQGAVMKAIGKCNYIYKEDPVPFINEATSLKMKKKKTKASSKEGQTLQTLVTLLREARARLNAQEVAEIDFEFLGYTLDYIDTGRRSTYAVQVVTQYAVESVRIKPSSGVLKWIKDKGNAIVDAYQNQAEGFVGNSVKKVGKAIGHTLVGATATKSATFNALVNAIVNTIGKGNKSKPDENDLKLMPDNDDVIIRF